MPVADLDHRVVGEESQLAVHAAIKKIRVFNCTEAPKLDTT
jgi:hypothetical protein